MIDAKELRIGNFIEIHGEFTKVLGIITYEHKGISLVRVKTSIIDGEIESEKVNPVPLDDEWLLKFAFMPTTNRFIHPSEPNFIVVKESGRYYLEAKGQVLTDKGMTDMKYVHEFQNLVFRVLGEEVIIHS